MRRWVASLFQSYCMHHASSKALLEGIGIVGVIAFPAFYLLRFTGKLPPLYDDLPLRAIATLLCLFLASRRFWPEKWQRFYMAFSYWTVFYCLAVLLPFTLLQNKASTPSVANVLLSAVLIMLLTDWRNSIAMILGGYVVSTILYLLLSPQPSFPSTLVWWLPLCGVLVSGGSIAKYVERRAELKRLRDLYAGLAGSIAHEMRGPLGQVQYALERIQAATSGTEQSAELAEPLDQAKRAVRQGLQAISITLQQLSERPLDTAAFAELSAAECVRKAVDDYAYETSEQRDRIGVDVEDDFVFRGDETLLQLILTNLLRNALYYLPAYPHLQVSIHLESSPANRLVVRDTGPGVPPELLGRLFGDFQSAGKAAGTGLGLAFCRRAMRAFGGDISCHSVPGAFTEFTLSFPTSASAARPQRPRVGSQTFTEVSPMRRFEGRTIMVVDDSALNRAIAAAMLRELGATVLEASQGVEALRLVENGPCPDAILMDMDMPGMTGAEATSILRAWPDAAASVPILALTADSSEVARESARAAGMNGYLSKPVQPPLLRAALERVLAQKPAETQAPCLLDEGRLAQLQALGLLNDLASVGAREIDQRCAQLQASVDASDLAGAREALHSLLGTTGSAGATALHELAEAFYGSVRQGRWPSSMDWVAQLQSLAQRTLRAMHTEVSARTAATDSSVRA